jgi:hypothetical protein
MWAEKLTWRRQAGAAQEVFRTGREAAGGSPFPQPAHPHLSLAPTLSSLTEGSLDAAVLTWVPFLSHLSIFLLVLLSQIDPGLWLEAT